jgi:hypothetical protein
MSNQGIVINTTTKLVTEECCNCGVLFAIPSDMRDRLLREGGCFYCPNGHAQHYTETREMKLRHQLDQTEAALEEARNQRDGALRQVAAHKGVATRLRKRTRAGVCTECHRHFNNLQEHMETEHGTPEERDAVVKRHIKPKKF